MFILRALIIISSGFWGLNAFNTARAEPPQQSIPWFEMDSHAGARQEAIRLCRNDQRFYDNPQTHFVCVNAEIAENRIYNKRKLQGLNALNTVQWWRENDFLRASALVACRRRAPFDQDMLQYCDVARQAEQDRALRVRG